jgi:uncharacterized protein (DUF2132 family)
MNTQHPRDPLHGIKLTKILDDLLAHYGWDELGRMIPIRCFTMNPSVSSSLKFLRRTPWARERVEALYLRLITSNDVETKMVWSPKDT